jgi:hypothetical protein
MSKSTKTYRKPTHDEIAAAAQRIYESEGRPQGKAMDHWLRAESQLVAQRKAEVESSAQSPVKPAPTWQTNAPRQTPQNLRHN